MPLIVPSTPAEAAANMPLPVTPKLSVRSAVRAIARFAPSACVCTSSVPSKVVRAFSVAAPSTPVFTFSVICPGVKPPSASSSPVCAFR